LVMADNCLAYLVYLTARTCQSGFVDHMT